MVRYPDPALSTPPLNDVRKAAVTPGRVVVVAIVVLGVVSAAFSWFWRRSRTDDCLAFWGSQAAFSIRQGELVRLTPLHSDTTKALPQGTAESWLLPKGYKSVGDSIEVTGKRGLVHGRLALVEDVGFDWESVPSPSSEGTWNVAVRFETRKGEHATVAFDFEGRRVLHVETGKVAIGKEPLVKGWSEFVARHMPPR